MKSTNENLRSKAIELIDNGDVWSLIGVNTIMCIDLAKFVAKHKVEVTCDYDVLSSNIPRMITTFEMLDPRKLFTLFVQIIRDVDMNYEDSYNVDTDTEFECGDLYKGHYIGSVGVNIMMYRRMKRLILREIDDVANDGVIVNNIKFNLVEGTYCGKNMTLNNYLNELDPMEVYGLFLKILYDDYTMKDLVFKIN